MGETTRGVSGGCEPLHWRLDGATDAPDAPLVVCLHGIRMSEDFFALLLRGLFDLPFRFVCLRGFHPAPPVPGQSVGASWYDYDGDQEAFRAELEQAERRIREAIIGLEAERGLRPRARVMLGFSQGGYCGSFVALRGLDLFSGLVVSGARVKTEFLEREIKAAGSAGFRTLLLHGDGDTAVPIEAAERSEAALRTAGVNVTFERFDSGHSIGRSQIASIARRLTEWLGA